MGMRERAHSVGTDLRAGPRPGGGCEVTTALPLQSLAPEEHEAAGNGAAERKAPEGKPQEGKAPEHEAPAHEAAEHQAPEHQAAEREAVR